MGARPKYCASTREEGPFSGEEPSRRAAAWALDVGSPGDVVWTARAVKLDPKAIVSGIGRLTGPVTTTALADPIFEMVAERIEAIIGDECCTTWTESVDHRALQELDRGLRRILIAWLARNGIRDYFLAKDIQQTAIPAEDPSA